MAFDSAMLIFEVLRLFPREELYSLSDQIRRSSRSVPVNIREGFAKRKYPDVFIRHLNDALGSSEETIVWLEFAHRCQYLSELRFKDLIENYQNISGKLYKLRTAWRKF